jgi:carbon-monoxide dehydrogenase large subunit
VVDARKATEPGAPLVHDDVPNNVSYTWSLGDKEACDKAFAAAEHVVELELVNQRLIPTALEPRAAVAQWNAAMEEMTLWTTSQNPHPIRLLLSLFTLKIPENKLRVISPDVGGGFGSKIFHYPEEVIVPWVARKINRPVKWVATRTEASMTDSQGRDHVTKCKLALKKEDDYRPLCPDMGTGLHVPADPRFSISACSRACTRSRHLGRKWARSPTRSRWRHRGAGRLTSSSGWYRRP